MANIAANNYKDRKILKRHKNFMPDRSSDRRPNNTGRIEFHAGQRPMSDTYFKPCDTKNGASKAIVFTWTLQSSPFVCWAEYSKIFAKHVLCCINLIFKIYTDKKKKWSNFGLNWICDYFTLTKQITYTQVPDANRQVFCVDLIKATTS